MAQSDLLAETGVPHLPANLDTVRWGRIGGGGGLDPVLRVRPGQVVTVDTISHEGILEDQGRDPVRFFGGYGVAAGSVLPDAVALAASDLVHDPAVDGPHVVVGPIEVVGADVGDVVTVDVLDLERRADYGIISNRHGRGALPERPGSDENGAPIGVVSRFATVSGGRAVVHAPDGRGLALPERRFLGLVATAPANGMVHSTPPGPFGGNLDVRALGIGSRLHLPVAVPGAMVQVGDPHFAQGDGEVALTALEGPLRATVRLGLRRLDEAIDGLVVPAGETEDSWVLLGLDPDLDVAVEHAVRAALRFVVAQTGLDDATVYAWLSAAVDVHVSQVVDGVKGAHVVIPKVALSPTD